VNRSDDFQKVAEVHREQAPLFLLWSYPASCAPPNSTERWCYNTYYVLLFKVATLRRKLTITVDDAVYEGLRRMVGQRKISQFIENLVKPYIADTTLDEGYRSMAADKGREAEAMEWSNALAGDNSDETR
jgi:hypothetical protein